MNLIALGCADPAHMFDGHFGESPGFTIVDCDGVRPDEWRDNPWSQEPLTTRPPKIAALLGDCDAIMVRAIARAGLDQLSQRFVVALATGDEVAQLAAQLTSNGVAGFRQFDRSLGKFVSTAR